MVLLLSNLELKSNYVGETEKILAFLGLDMTLEIESCLLEGLPKEHSRLF